MPDVVSVERVIPATPSVGAGGRFWRYELAPTEGGTLVRESWDISQERALTTPVVRKAAAVTEKNMAATLARIEEVLTCSS